MKKTLLLITTFICCRCFAQDFSIAANFGLGFPLDEFKQVNDRTSAGGRFNFMYKPSPGLPLSVGIELGYQVRGLKYQNFAGYVLGFYDEFQLTASSNIFSAFLNARLEAPGNMAVKPFIDGMIGTNDFFSSVTVNRQNYYDGTEVSYSNSSRARWVLAYGGSVGLDIRLSRRNNLWLEVKTTYLTGGRTTYLADPKITDQGDAAFTEYTSATNMLIPQVGVKFDF